MLFYFYIFHVNFFMQYFSTRKFFFQIDILVNRKKNCSFPTCIRFWPERWGRYCCLTMMYFFVSMYPLSGGNNLLRVSCTNSMDQLLFTDCTFEGSFFEFYSNFPRKWKTNKYEIYGEKSEKLRLVTVAISLLL